MICSPTNFERRFNRDIIGVYPTYMRLVTVDLGLNIGQTQRQMTDSILKL